MLKVCEDNLANLKSIERLFSQNASLDREEKKAVTMLRAARNKLGNDYKRAKSRFHDVDASAKAKLRKYALFGVDNPNRSASAPPSGKAAREQGRYVTRAERDRFVNEKLVIQDQINVNNEIIEERDEAMRDIHKNLWKSGKFSADLAELVQDQDHSIKLIEEHVDNS